MSIFTHFMRMFMGFLPTFLRKFSQVKLWRCKNKMIFRMSGQTIMEHSVLACCNMVVHKRNWKYFCPHIYKHGECHKIQENHFKNYFWLVLHFRVVLGSPLMKKVKINVRSVYELRLKLLYEIMGVTVSLFYVQENSKLI